MTILALVEKAVQAGARRASAASEAGLDPRTLERWRAGAVDDERRGPRTVPRNKLSARERERVVGIATSPEFRDLSPKQIVLLTIASPRGNSVKFTGEERFKSGELHR